MKELQIPHVSDTIGQKYLEYLLNNPDEYDSKIRSIPTDARFFAVTECRGLRKGVYIEWSVYSGCGEYYYSMSFIPFPDFKRKVESLKRVERMIEMMDQLEHLKMTLYEEAPEIENYIERVMEPHWYSLSLEEMAELREHYKTNTKKGDSQ